MFRANFVMRIIKMKTRKKKHQMRIHVQINNCLSPNQYQNVVTHIQRGLHFRTNKKTNISHIEKKSYTLCTYMMVISFLRCDTRPIPIEIPLIVI